MRILSEAKGASLSPGAAPVPRLTLEQKRCIHTDSNDEENDVFRSPGYANGRHSADGTPNGSKDHEVKAAHTRRFVCDTNPEGMFAEAAGSDVASKHSSRFVCDTNPEGMFAEITRSDDARKPARNDEVGVWVSTSSGNASSNAVSLRPAIPYDHILIPYVREHCLNCLPPDKEFRQLRKTFYRKIQPIYNLIPESEIEGDDTPSTIVLRQVISLAAATDAAMINNLKLANQGPDKLSFAEFSQKLSGAIRTTLATSIISDRTVNIRALCMLSLYFQPSSIEESEVPAHFFAEAVHHSQTLGMHLLRTGDPALETLFCAVWAVDVINAAAYGRPRNFHERDFAGDLDQCISRQEPCFRLWLNMSRWLDQTIDLYRPAASATLAEFKPFVDLPVLEPMIVEAKALEVPTFLIGEPNLRKCMLGFNSPLLQRLSKYSTMPSSSSPVGWRGPEPLRGPTRRTPRAFPQQQQTHAAPSPPSASPTASDERS